MNLHTFSPCKDLVKYNAKLFVLDFNTNESSPSNFLVNELLDIL